METNVNGVVWWTVNEKKPVRVHTVPTNTVQGRFLFLEKRKSKRHVTGIVTHVEPGKVIISFK